MIFKGIIKREIASTTTNKTAIILCFPDFLMQRSTALMPMKAENKEMTPIIAEYPKLSQSRNRNWIDTDKEAIITIY